MVNSWKFLNARPNDDGFTIQRKTPENATDVMMLAYNSSKMHVWLQQFTKFAIDIIILLAPTKAIAPIDINIDTLVRFDSSVQQEISLCALLDRITALTSNGLRYRRRGRIIMVVGSIACLIAGFCLRPAVRGSHSPAVYRRICLSVLLSTIPRFHQASR